MTAKSATKKVLAYTVRPGQTLAFTEGDFDVKNSGFGDPLVYGFCELEGRSAAPWVMTLEPGTKIVMLPRHRVIQTI